MIKRKKIAAYALSGIVVASCAMAYAAGGIQPPDFGQGGPPMGGPGMMGGPGAGSAISAYGDNIYVLRGSTLYQYSAKDLTIVKKVTLKLDLPARPRNDQGAPPELNNDSVLTQTGHGGSPLYASIQPPDFGGQGGPGGMMPPIGGGPGGASISATASYVYIAAGQTLYQYKVDGLTLNKKIKLPEIERPKSQE